MKLLFWLLISILPGLFARQFRPGEWYASLPKAPWSPPNVAFPIVWTILYVLMGVSSWLVFRERGWEKRTAMTLFFVQLVLNGLWSWIFFGQHKIGPALVELGVLWGFVIVMLVVFWRISALAGTLLIPYQIWLTIAFSLNAYIWWSVK